MIQFNAEYYYNLIKKFNYDPLNLRRIDFSLGDLSKEDLQIRWICHHNADIFAKNSRAGNKSIICTGIGLSGPPHIGTISQILRAIFLQKSGLTISFVLGDLDAFNGKNIPLEETRNLAKKYKEFIKRPL